MNNLIYGVWNGEVYDCRRGKAPNAAPSLVGLDDFAPHNKTRAFVADRGFLIFERDTSLIKAFSQYMTQAAQESCGRCTPCRVGTQRLRDLLWEFAEGRADESILDEIEGTAEHVANTSLCGIGQSTPRALIAALRHFRDEFKPISPAQAVFQHSFTYTTAPCIEACPSKVDVPRYIDGVRDGKFDFALGVVLDNYPMAGACGRVCVRFCESACRRAMAEAPVGIRQIKRFAADQAITNNRLHFSKPSEKHDKSVAVIGAGPAGITCAYRLLLQGFKVDIFDAQQAAGGMASIGIPSYRLPKDILKKETEDIVRELGGQFYYGKALGDSLSVDDLLKNGYGAVFLAYGASQGTHFGIKNEYPDLDGYITGVDFLFKVYQHVEAGKTFNLDGDVVVVGGGNVAMDCVRSARRMGAKNVHLLYRRTEEDMPADREEIVAARDEGVVYHFLTNPTGLVVDNRRVKALELVKMRQTERDAKGRRNVEAIEGSTYTMPSDLVIAAIGQQVERNVLKPGEGIELDRDNCVVVNPETLETTRKGVFAGGDCVLKPQTLVHALGHGERAAESIADYLLNGAVSIKPEYRMQEVLKKNALLKDECLEKPVVFRPRVVSPELDAAARSRNFDEVEHNISKEAAYEETERCMRCYRLYSLVTERELVGNAS
ncbi:MAG: FAD-dependent oxidoreductase [Candidatus Accumulibacter sp.]|nr:FAD-dependent oxidoreductase [Accumulibacter sp.]